MTITDADREAAASVAVLVEMRDLIRDGRADHHAEPWARHREAAFEAGRQEAWGYWYRQGKDDGIQHERERIVAWIVRQPPHLSLQEYADAIEAGEHMT